MKTPKNPNTEFWNVKIFVVETEGIRTVKTSKYQEVETIEDFHFQETRFRFLFQNLSFIK